MIIGRIEAIETYYASTWFRSRLEARWAVFFDALGIQWVYEHEGFELDDRLGRYLPDFWLPRWGCWAEVKPTQFTPVQYEKAALLDGGCLLLDVESPSEMVGYYWTGWPEASYRHYASHEDYGRVLLTPSASKKRLWFLLGETPTSYPFDRYAETAARSARFEFGQNGYKRPRAVWSGLDWGQTEYGELPY